MRKKKWVKRKEIPILSPHSNAPPLSLSCLFSSLFSSSSLLKCPHTPLLLCSFPTVSSFSSPLPPLLLYSSHLSVPLTPPSTSHFSLLLSLLLFPSLQYFTGFPIPCLFSPPPALFLVPPLPSISTPLHPPRLCSSLCALPFSVLPQAQTYGALLSAIVIH